MPRNFLAIFSQKEGSTVVVRTLDRLKGVHTVNVTSPSSAEPYDRHHCGPMRHADLEWSLNEILKPGPVDMERLQQVYSKTSTNHLAEIPDEGARGLKMRFTPPRLNHVPKMPAPVRLPVLAAARTVRKARYPKMIIDLCARNNVVVFFFVRQDIYRWALSKYHGDGTGKPGHMQFMNEKQREQAFQPIEVDPRGLSKLIKKCRRIHRDNRRLEARLRKAGVDVYPLRYEDFLADKKAYYERLLGLIEVDPVEAGLYDILAEPEPLKRVHSSKLEDWVLNHAEIERQFGGAWEGWPGGAR